MSPPPLLLGVLLQDNTNFIHIHHWSDGRTLLHSVGILLGSPAYEPGAAPALPSVKNCLILSTNTTLLPALVPHAAVATPLPLLVYLTSNVSIGQHPPLPTGGVIIKRPVVFVGMQSLLTSIDFEMVVNQLNLTGSQYSNTTFVGVVLENLAPGDIITSAVASPFSIAITNNVWAVMYNRYACVRVCEGVVHAHAWCPLSSTLALLTAPLALALPVSRHPAITIASLPCGCVPQVPCTPNSICCAPTACA